MKKFALLFLVSLLVGCGGSSDSLTPLSGDAVILAFGDSLTFGTGTTPDKSYPAVLQELSGRKVVNAGIPGELSAQGLARLPGLLDAHRPDLLILIHGGNDILRKKSLEQAADNLREMIALARAKGAEVVMMAVPNPTLVLSPADFYASVAEETGVPIEIDALADILQFPSNKSDTIHPNAKGYRKMAESLYALLEDHQAL